MPVKNMTRYVPQFPAPRNSRDNADAKILAQGVAWLVFGHFFFSFLFSFFAERHLVVVVVIVVDGGVCLHKPARNVCTETFSFLLKPGFKRDYTYEWWTTRK